MMWPIFYSKSLQALHLENNDIPEKILRTLLFVFGIQKANEGDLFDSSNSNQIARFKAEPRWDTATPTGGEEEGNLRTFVPLEDETRITTKD